MDLTPQQQIFEQFAKAENILIALPQHVQADMVGSALALALFLKKMEKQVTVAASGPVPPQLHFLPAVQTIVSSLQDAQSLVISVDTSVKELDEISYQAHSGSLSIYVRPKHGIFTQEDVTFSEEKTPYDVVVTLGAQTLEHLGALFEEHAETFFSTPKINIDISPSNTYFGAINLVDINSTSIAELLSSLLSSFENQLVDEDIATCLLAGIITKTHSFQHVQTTPSAFLKASELIALGGRQQEIIKHFYKTKSLPLLRLWGRALARLKILDDLGLVYSMLNLSDFGKAGATDQDITAVFKELQENIAGYKIVGLACEMLGGGTRVLLALHQQIPGQNIIEALGGSGDIKESESEAFKIIDMHLPDAPFTEIENKLMEAFKQLPAAA